MNDKIINSISERMKLIPYDSEDPVNITKFELNHIRKQIIDNFDSDFTLFIFDLCSRRYKVIPFCNDNC